MAKYGDFIKDKYALIYFHCGINNDTGDAHTIASDLKGKCIVTKIDTEKNTELCNALRIVDTPCFLFYQDGQLVFRQILHRDAYYQYTIQEMVLNHINNVTN